MLLFAVTSCALRGSDRDLADGLSEPAEDVLLDFCCCLQLQPVNSMLLFAVTARKLYVAVCCYSL